MRIYATREDIAKIKARGMIGWIRLLEKLAPLPTHCESCQAKQVEMAVLNYEVKNSSTETPLAWLESGDLS